MGFDLVGLAPIAPPPDAERLRRWLARGLHADMRWLERTLPRILDPRRILPGEGTLLVVGQGHARPAAALPGGGRVARYAAGRDYHNLLRRRLRRLARRLAERGIAGRWRAIVDAGPLLERSHAQVAGLGFASRAANLLHPEHGPWFFLGALLLDVDLLGPDAPAPVPPPGSCGTCTACIDRCPTGAIPAPGVVDANRCISYHTIENRGTVPHALRPLLGEWVFGCDVCSEVCPWGSRAPDRSELWGTHPAVESLGLVDLLRLPAGSFAATLEGSPLRRPGRDGLARNAAHVLGNHPVDGGAAALERALEDRSALVREAAAWALLRGHAADAGVRAAVERARAREDDPGARAGLERSLEEEP